MEEEARLADQKRLSTTKTNGRGGERDGNERAKGKDEGMNAEAEEKGVAARLTDYLRENDDMSDLSVPSLSRTGSEEKENGRRENSSGEDHKRSEEDRGTGESHPPVKENEPPEESSESDAPTKGSMRGLPKTPSNQTVERRLARARQALEER